MKKLNISVLAFAIGLVFSADTLAENMSRRQYKSLEKNINAEYKIAKAGCDTLAGNAKDICLAEAEGKKNVSRTALEDNYKPTVKTRYNARVAKADADYSVAIEKCDDKSGNDQDVCVKEAEAVKVQETASAEAQMKTLKADAVAIEKSADAQKDATTDMRDANYAVAKEKCEALVNDAKDLCMKDAKARFGQ